MALVDYGVWGILLLAFIDSAGIPVAMGMDALVVLIAAKAPEQAYLGAAMAVLGSLVGNVFLFTASRKGGSKLLQDPPEPGNPQRFRAWFQRYGLATVFIPALVPVIPLPLKVFVISAGVFRTSLRSFLSVILVARVIRYFGEAWLGVRVGMESTSYLREHVWTMTGAAVGLVAVTIVVLRLNERWRRSRA
ncbi:MAG TPA: VTT domain-containing protein [Bryobacteraceae bacterium]|nr:VTT domain-containing protein [Bryobacteraceae bacterium]